MSHWLVVGFIFTASLCFGLPVAFVLILSSFVGLAMLRGWDVALSAISSMPYAKTADAGLLVIPLFVVMGFLASRAGVSEKAYEVAFKFVGHLRAGLGIATVFACAAFAATSGSSVATSAAVGKIALGEMRRVGYQDMIAAGTVASAGLLGILIPPSIMLVVYGIVTEQHIGKLLIAGIIPGILTAGIFSLGLYVLAILRPQLMPIVGKPLPWGQRLASLKDARGIVILFTIVVGGIYSGFFTSTEAAAVGACVALVMALMRKGVTCRDIIADGRESARICSMIFLILVGAGLFSQYVALSGLATGFTKVVVDLEINRYVLLTLILLAYVPLGMFLEPISMCLITLPIVFPAITKLGFDGIWFGILVTKMSELANITPPVGVNVYVIRGMSRGISLENVFRGASLFVFLEIIILAILVAFPQISLWLPNLMFK
jgi:tripartite ATP-independent transporter DctM subunit